MLDLRSLARALGGEAFGNRARVPGIGHSQQDRSVSIRLDRRAPDGFLVHCFGAGNALAEKKRIRELLGSFVPLTPARGHVASDPVTVELEKAQRTALALSIWNEAGPPWDTPVQVHLRTRRLELPESAACIAVRYHPACPFAGERTPAMVCLIRDVRTNEPTAIHRTALSLDGRQVRVRNKDRLALGPTRGGAIKLTPDEDVTVCLGVGEGIETALSLRNRPEFGPSPVWALMSANNLGQLPVLAGIESLWIAVDYDESGTGQRASRACSRSWRASGAETFLTTPTEPRTDLNDLLTRVRDA